MKRKMAAIMPFIILPLILPVYVLLDSFLLVDIFGCGCVPTAQTNMLNIPFNANDLRLTVFSVLTVGLSVWGIVISRRFSKHRAKIPYCVAVILWNGILTLWVVKTFMWG